MIKQTFILLITFQLIACSADKSRDNTPPAKKNVKITTIKVQANVAQAQKYISNPCDTFSYEFLGLYPILDTLPLASEDTLVMDNYLKSLGFTVTNSAYGNWQYGPRVITLELTKGNCNCKVFKKYGYHAVLPDGTYNMQVTEKVVCNSTNPTVD